MDAEKELKENLKDQISAGEQDENVKKMKKLEKSNEKVLKKAETAQLKAEKALN